MGTRSLTKFYESKHGMPFAVMYRQYDGYPRGHGKQLVEFLQSRAWVNGIKSNEKRTVSNGIGCLAAQAVCFFKKDPNKAGDFYLQGDCYPGASDEEFIYEVRAIEADSSWHLTIRDVYKNEKIFNGDVRGIDTDAGIFVG